MKNDDRRVARVERELQHVIAKYLISGFKHPLPGLVTVTRVQMPKDLRTAKVFASVLGEGNEFSNVIDILNKNAFEIQSFIGKELKMRYCPKLTFFADHTTEQALKIEKILSEIKKSNP